MNGEKLSFKTIIAIASVVIVIASGILTYESSQNDRISRHDVKIDRLEKDITEFKEFRQDISEIKENLVRLTTIIKTKLEKDK
jgi:hypothetical protein